jgi:hypothetical protein
MWIRKEKSETIWTTNGFLVFCHYGEFREWLLKTRIKPDWDESDKTEITREVMTGARVTRRYRHGE